MVHDHNPGPKAPPWIKERARVEGAKEMSGEEQLPEDRWRRVGASGVVERKGVRRDDPVEILPPHSGRKYLLNPIGGDGN